MLQKDLTGSRFERLLVVRKVDFMKRGRTVWLCRCDCGEQVEVVRNQLVGGISKSCGCLRRETARRQGQRKKPRGAASPHWKGGRHVNQRGYVILSGTDYPNSRRVGWVFEHVYVMSKHLGRPLLPGEQVHHKNGVRDDNRIENLELWVSNQPHGARPEDLVKWAQEILVRYRHLVRG
jgi:hypothetical protein